MATQDDINGIVNGIVNAYTNQRIAYHGGYPGECTSPVKYYVENLTGKQAPYMANDRADGWGTNFPAELAPYFTHEVFQPGKSYPKGTILMWNSPHIAIVLSSNGSNMADVFEQNADPDGAPCKSANRIVNSAYHTCNFALVPIVGSPAPPPAPVTTPPAPRYTVIETYPQGRQVQLNKQPTNLWGMNYDFATMVKSPVEVHNQGEVWTVTNKVHHEDGYDYYRRDGQVDGFNVADCDDYTPPQVPYVPPAAPVTVTPVTYYTVLPDVIKYYDSAEKVKQDNPSGVKAKGQYIELARDGIAVKLVKSNSEVNGDFWISDIENKLPEVSTQVPSQPVDPPAPKNEPTDVADNSIPIPDSPAPKEKPSYRLINTVTRTYYGPAGQQFPDLEGKTKNVITLTPGKAYDFSMEAYTADNDYLILDYSMKRGYRHGVPHDLLRQPNMLEEVEQEAGSWLDFIETEGKRAYTLIRDISPVKISQATVRVKQAIDGFKDGRKR